MKRLVLALLIVASCKQKGDASKGKLPLPSGGAAEPNDGGMIEGAWSYDVKTWSFALDHTDVTLEDVGMTTAIDALRERTGAELVINGGFFDEGGKPLGLTISNGAQHSPLAKKLSGGVVTIANDHAQLFATESYEQPEATRFAVQCRPRLVVNKQPNVRSDDGKRSERTALCLRDDGARLDVYIVRGAEGGPSLFGLGKWLAAQGCEDALNLDGGPSTGAAWIENGEKRLLAPRGPVRHAIVFKKRS